MATKGTTLLEMIAFRIKEYDIVFTKVYAVQGRKWFGWVTIKEYTASCTNDEELWWAKACAQNLLDELNKEQ
jgi:hypothetical protein